MRRGVGTSVLLMLAMCDRAYAGTSESVEISSSSARERWVEARRQDAAKKMWTGFLYLTVS